MQKSYTAKSKIIGPCGPCAFINLTGKKGSAKLEIELSKIGKFKPFGGTEYTGFLEWGDKYNLPIKVFTTSKNLNKKMFAFIFELEKTPREKQKILKSKAINLFKEQNEKYKNKICLTENITKKLNSLLEEKYKVAVGLSVFNPKKKKFSPHWTVAYKKIGKNYHFLDSSKRLKGYRVLSQNQLRTAFNKSKELGFHPALVIIDK